MKPKLLGTEFFPLSCNILDFRHNIAIPQGRENKKSEADVRENHSKQNTHNTQTTTRLFIRYTVGTVNIRRGSVPHTGIKQHLSRGVHQHEEGSTETHEHRSVLFETAPKPVFGCVEGKVRIDTGNNNHSHSKRDVVTSGTGGSRDPHT